MKSQSLSWKSILTLSTPWLFPLLWYVYCAFITPAHTFFHVVDNDYHMAALDWVRGLPVYSGGGFGFTYAPTSAALLAPFAFLSEPVFAFVWRILSTLVLGAGIYYFCQIMNTKNMKRTYFIVTFLSAVLCKAGFFEGQMHIMTTSLMMLSLAMLVKDHFWKSAVFMALALALKPTSIVITLLVLVLYPRLSWKLVLMILATFVFTFLIQHPHYVVQQYIGFYHNFSNSMKYDGLHPNGWASFFGAIHYYFGYTGSGAFEFLIRAVMALVTFALCFSIKKRSNGNTAVFAILTLGMSYLMLFNSRTENNDYIMVIPAMGVSLALAYDAAAHYLKYGLYFLFFCMAINWNFTIWLSLHNNLWMYPTAVLIYALGMLVYFFRSKQIQVYDDSSDEALISVR